MDQSKKKRRKTSINMKLGFALLIALLIPTLLIALTSYNSAKSEIESQIQASAFQSVSTVDAFIYKHVEPIVNDVDYFAGRMNQAAWQAEDWTPILTDLAQYFETSEGIVSSFIGTVDGDMIQHPDLGLMNNPDFDPRTRPWYQNAEANPGQVIVSDPHQSASTGDWVVTISKQLADGSGVFAANLGMDELYTLISTIKVGETGYPFLMTEGKVMIAHPTIEGGTDVAEEPWAEKTVTTNDDTFDYEFEGTDKQMFVHTNALTGWKIGGTMFKSEITEATSPILKTTAFVVIVALAILGVFIIVIIRSITKPLKEITDAAAVMSSGDLRTKLSINKRDEIGVLSKSFQKMGDMLSSIISHIHNKSAVISSSSEELTATLMESSRATEQISAAMNDVQEGLANQTMKLSQSFESLKNVSDDIHEISENTTQVTLKAQQAEKTADIGHDIVISTQNQMATIEGTFNALSSDIETVNNYANEINEIVNVITSISDQTNLLALNAAIEAARAGEAGKGFAVVADEVRKLAEQTNNSSIQVKEIITSIQRESSKSVESMNTSLNEVKKGLEMFAQTETNFLEVKSFIEEITDQLEAVQIRAQKIAANSEQVVSDMQVVERISTESKSQLETVSVAAEEQLCSMEEISATAEALESIVEDLLEEVRLFKVN
ncbi:methyl-accepting chemotaxis protein [Lysinibacillus sp. KU-BSD001]|uniref:methyl-accepting chemotaxis protein n=1 Tax=Lysinibacillus sp. KU-BSD001 TaxID=3141328 RepID=UPI0036E5019D